MKLQYLYGYRNNSLTRIGILTVVPVDEDTLQFSMSICHKHDTFNKETGLEIAQRKKELNTVLICPETTFIKRDKELVLIDTVVAISIFIQACQKYYKNKFIVLPPIQYFDNSREMIRCLSN